MSYGCGDEDCTNCYQPANYAIVDEDGEVLDRYVDEGTALDQIDMDAREAADGDDVEYPPGCVVEYQADPRREWPDCWADRDPDKLGAILGTELRIEADEVGWTKASVWFGESNMGDDAVSHGYLAAYEFDMADGISQCLDITTYVTGKPGDYGVEEMSHTYRRDSDGEIMEDADEDYTYDYGSPLAYRTFSQAIKVARSLAMNDDRWKLASWQPSC